MTTSEPTTGEIVRALRGGGIYGITTALELKVIARLESQERDLETLRAFHERYAEQTSKQYVVAVCGLTARAEQAEKERDAAVADIEELLGQDDFIGICWACKSHDKCVGTRDVKITCVPKWRGLPQEGEVKK